MNTQARSRYPLFIAALAGLVLARCECPLDGSVTLPDGGVMVYHNKGTLTLGGALDGGYPIDAVAGTQSGHFILGMSSTEDATSLFSFYSDLGTATPEAGTFDGDAGRSSAAVSADGISWTENTSAGDDFTLVLTAVDVASIQSSPTSGLVTGTLDLTLHRSGVHPSDAGADAGVEGGTVTVHAEF